jgi:hypothetical protein
MRFDFWPAQSSATSPMSVHIVGAAVAIAPALLAAFICAFDGWKAAVWTLSFGYMLLGMAMAQRLARPRGR